MRKIFLFLFINTLLSITYAQKISISSILATAEKDDRILKNTYTNQFSQTLDYRLPLLKKIDFRLGVNGNNTSDTLDGGLRNEDYFAISLTPNNLKERRLQNALKPAQINVYNAEYQVIMHQVLLERYQSIALIFFQQKLYDIRLTLKDLLLKKTDIISLSLDRGVEVRFKDIMDTENDKNALETVLLDHQNNTAAQWLRIRQFLKNAATNQSLSIDFQRFIGINNLEKNINTFRKDSVLTHPLVEYRMAQANYTAAELALEDIQNHQVLSFVQAGFTRPNYEPNTQKKFKPVNNVALRIGLTIPILANNNLKHANTALQLREDEQNSILTAQLQQKVIDNQYIRLENLIKNLRLNEKNEQQSLIKKMLNNATLTAQITPIELLDLQISQKKLAIRSLEISADITNEYLRLLDMIGAFAKYPTRVFLEE